MKLTHFKIIPFIVSAFALLVLSGCDGTTGIASDSGIAGINTANTANTANTTFFENNTTTLVADLTITTSDINVSNATTNITKVTVSVNVDPHPVPYDIIWILKSPSGTEITLSTNKGSGPSFIVTFDDNATNAMIDELIYGGSFVNGTYIPEEPLVTFEGENANGIWTLIMEDVIPGGTGPLNSWSLTIE